MVTRTTRNGCAAQGRWWAVPKRGKTNEPAFVAHTAAKVAELKGVSVAELEAVTTDNFFRLFTKAERIACA